MSTRCPECRGVDTHKMDCSRRQPRVFGHCNSPKCVLQRHTVQAGNVWHQDATGRAWVTGPPR